MDRSAVYRWATSQRLLRIFGIKQVELQRKLHLQTDQSWILIQILKLFEETLTEFVILEIYCISNKKIVPSFY